MTVGEMIETEDAAKLATEMGMQLGQGWLFGRPAPKPVSRPRASAPLPVRRKGVTETWG